MAPTDFVRKEPPEEIRVFVCPVHGHIQSSQAAEVKGLVACLVQVETSWKNYGSCRETCEVLVYKREIA